MWDTLGSAAVKVADEPGIHSSRVESLLTCTRSWVQFPVLPKAKEQNGDGNGAGACV